MLFEVNAMGYQAGGRNIVSALSFGVRAGEHMMLLGPSGCGKTTILNLLAGLVRPMHGTIRFDGLSYDTLNTPSRDALRRRSFGLIFQRLHLIGHLNVTDNIALAQDTCDPHRIKTILSDLGLTGRERQMARTLSVGEAQRVAIARAVANNPKVIFADEPTSALDDANASKVMDLIFEQAAKTGATVIAATHDARITGRFATVLELPS